MIFAHHTHVFPAEIRPDGTVERLLKSMDSYGIDRAVCFPPFPYHMSQARMGNPNDWLQQEIATHGDRLVAFGALDPESRSAPDEVRRLAGLGVRGIKLHPAAQRFRIDSELARPFYEAASEAQMVITFHTGVHDAPIELTRPALIDGLLFRYPGITVTLEHIGGRALREEAIGVIQNHRAFPRNPENPGRAYGGLTSVAAVPTAHPWYLGREGMTDMARTIGAELLVFGLDYPYNPPGHFGRLVREIRQLPLPREKIDLILGGNLSRLID